MEGSLRAQLIAVRDRRHSKNHPFFELWARGKLTREQTAIYCAQHFHFVGEYLNWMAYEASQIRERDVKAYLFENLGDEENPEDRHLDMLLDYVASCGLPKESVEKAKVLPHTEALQNWGWRVVYQRPWQIALTGMFIGLESQFADICKKIVPALHEHYGYKPGSREIRFFEEHIGADEIHAAKAMVIVEKYCVSPEIREQAAKIVEEATIKRWAYMNGIYWYALHGKEDDTPVLEGL
ncbi:MAG TPA: iron-containing redox enzyme family protein [Candidatus Acidoferrales bacterium]|nr:iron-containing redox enzyme family protein [Candidatus Acidoferrales bacterium]